MTPTPTPPRRPLRPMRWWWVLLGVALVAASMWASTTWLLEVAGPDRKLQIEAIKTGLTIGAGTGGGVALLLAARRQWLNERAQAHQEDVAVATQAHQEKVAAITEHDATERRVTDLFTKVVDQLGFETAAVRLGGLYALERLAQDHPAHRQTIVNVICAYLRMPFTPPEQVASSQLEPSPSAETPEPTATSPDPREERQVRLTAQRILADHLRDDRTPEQREASPPDARFWPGMRLDLTGAILLDLDFTRCHFEGVFANATFCGHARFTGAEFSGDAWFDKAQFTGNAGFNEAQFTSDAGFARAQFTSDAEFNEAQFTSDARFTGAQFTGNAWFTGAQFTGPIEFAEARVGDISAVHRWPPGWQVQPNGDGSGTLVPQDEEQPEPTEE